VASRRWASALLTAAIASGCAGMLTACGSSSDSSAVPQTGSQKPLTAATVDVRPTGDPNFKVDAASVHFQIDNAGLLHISLTVVSHAAVRSTVTMTATLVDAAGAAVAQAVGGAVNVDPGTSQPIELTGNRPTGVIAAVNLVITSQPSPTPIS
jgi:hypothetical protein